MSRTPLTEPTPVHRSEFLPPQSTFAHSSRIRDCAHARCVCVCVCVCVHMHMKVHVYHVCVFAFVCASGALIFVLAILAKCHQHKTAICRGLGLGKLGSVLERSRAQTAMECRCTCACIQLVQRFLLYSCHMLYIPVLQMLLHLLMSVITLCNLHCTVRQVW